MTVTAAPARAAAAFEAAWNRARAGAHVFLTYEGGTAPGQRVDAGAWFHERLPGDGGLLDRCLGHTLDVGCGPGRITAALTRRGRPALGIDVSAAAVRLAGARGATALRRDVFGHLPGHGRWHDLLLADGNIGIGGDPARLLRRCRDLVSPRGRLHVELSRPGTPSWIGPARLTGGGAFPWAVVSADDIEARARSAGLRVLTRWTEADRWFATLVPA